MAPMPSSRSLAALLASLVALILAIAPLTAKTASREKFSSTLEYQPEIAAQLVEASGESCLYGYDFASGDSFYNYFRDYNPSTGRYQQSDPIGLWGGENTFAYVIGNPLTFADIRGLCPSGGSGGCGGGGSPPKGLGNPFKGKSPLEIDQMFRRKGFKLSGPNPAGGKGGYVNPGTGRSYHIDWANRFCEPPHVDVNRPRAYRGPLTKKKYPI